MEEDIKILEEFYTKGYPMMYIKYGGGIKANSKIQRALENLIKGYRELKEMLKHRIKYTNELEKDLFENASNYVIPKSKRKEKIEELEKRIEQYNEYSK